MTTIKSVSDTFFFMTNWRLTTVSAKILARNPLDEIRRAFALFDVDNTGKISFADLKRVAQELGENLADEELHAMIEEFDLDQDGEINEDEFIAICSEH
jgi:centrin-3